MTDTIQTDTPKRFQCRHIHTEGRRCGSASLRGEEFCCFHHTSRKPVTNPRTRRSRQATFDLPLPEDRGAIQLSIGEVLRRIASNAIDPRRAGLLLYGLQIAALNLPPHKPAKTRREQESAIVEEIITDPTHGTVAPTFELPDPDAPREDSLTAQLLKAIRKGQEEIEAECRAKFEAELQPQPAPIPEPQPATLPTLNAAASHTVIPSEVGNLLLTPPLMLSFRAKSRNLLLALVLALLPVIPEGNLLSLLLLQLLPLLVIQERSGGIWCCPIPTQIPPGTPKAAPASPKGQRAGTY